MPDGVTDNLPELAAALDELAASLDFTRPGRDGSLGRTLIGIIHEGIADRNREAVDPDGAPWAGNRGGYGKRKASAGLPVGVGIYPGGKPGGEMLSLVEIQGETKVEPDSVESGYGTSDGARDKGDWFTHGSAGPDGLRSGAENQPGRPFYGIGEEDAEAVMEEAGRFLDDLLR